MVPSGLTIYKNVTTTNRFIVKKILKYFNANQKIQVILQISIFWGGHEAQLIKIRVQLIRKCNKLL